MFLCIPQFIRHNWGSLVISTKTITSHGVKRGSGGGVAQLIPAYCCRLLPEVESQKMLEYSTLPSSSDWTLEEDLQWVLPPQELPALAPGPVYLPLPAVGQRPGAGPRLP